MPSRVSSLRNVEFILWLPRREFSGIPLRYLLVSRPWARTENAITPMPFSAHVFSSDVFAAGDTDGSVGPSGPSIHRLNME